MLHSDASQENSAPLTTPTPPLSNPYPRVETRRHATVLALSVGGGIGISFLGLYHAPGLGWTLATWLASAAWVLLSLVQKRSLVREEKQILAVVVVLASLFTLRSSPWLLAGNLVAVGILLFLLPLIARAKLSSVTLSSIVKETLLTVVTVPVAPIDLLRDDLKIGEAAVGARSYLRKPLLGALLASPLLFVFALLFSWADPVFASLVKDVFSFEGFGEGQTGAILLVGTVYGAFLLAFSRRAGHEAPHFAQARTKALIGSTELGTVVVLLNALFALFMWIQIRQLLGFSAALEIPGVTYSSSAREGFFQLMAVTVLVSSVVLVVDWFALGSDPVSLRRLRIALAVLVALTLGVASSALWRMHLYNDAYGHTQLRFFSSAMMVWWMSLLGWMFRSVLTGRRDRFFKGALISGICGVVLLHVVNPDGIIAKGNIARALEQDKALDTYYLSKLSYDAANEIDSGLRLFSCDEENVGTENLRQGFVVANYMSKSAQNELDEWSLLSWNLARSRAASLTNRYCSTTAP